MKSEETFPNTNPHYAIVRAPDSSTGSEITGHLFTIGHGVPNPALIISWGDFDLGATPTSPWHLTDCWTFRNPSGYLLGAPPKSFWSIVTVMPHHGGSAPEIVLKVFRPEDPGVIFPEADLVFGVVPVGSSRHVMAQRYSTLRNHVTRNPIDVLGTCMTARGILEDTLFDLISRRSAPPAKRNLETLIADARQLGIIPHEAARSEATLVRHYGNLDHAGRRHRDGITLTNGHAFTSARALISVLGSLCP